MDKITIIIPTFNDESFIRNAINSVITQTSHDWQLIIVNDCSTDNTKDIVEGYAECFPNKIKVVNNKENKGVGISRKIGLNNCDTPYIAFLDSDDLLNSDYVCNCIKLIEYYDADIIFPSTLISYPEQRVIHPLDAGDFLCEGEATIQPYLNAQTKFLTGKVFKTELLKEIPWSENRVGEDTQTLFFALYNANKVRTSSYLGYVHQFRQGSLLADAPHFYCYCYSAMASLEIIDYVSKKNDNKLYDALLKAEYLNYQNAINIVNDKEKGLEATGTHKGDNVKDKWEYIKKWFDNKTE